MTDHTTTKVESNTRTNLDLDKAGKFVKPREYSTSGAWTKVNKRSQRSINSNWEEYIMLILSSRQPAHYYLHE
jgi:hypothetical protein